MISILFPLPVPCRLQVHHIEIKADSLFEDEDFQNTEMFVLPGGLPGTTNLGACPDLCKLLADSARDGKYVAAICAAPSVLGQLHILEGKKATCYPGFDDQLIGADYLTDKVVIDQNIITSRGMGTAIEFAAALISVLKDQETAKSLLASIMY